MVQIERFAFQGTAALLGGRLHRPVSIPLDVSGASALPVEGGKATITFRDLTIGGGVIRIDRGSTHAHGEADEEPPLRGARTRAPQCTHAHAAAEVRGLTVGRKTKMTARRVRAELSASCQLEAHQPSIGAMSGAQFVGIAFGKYRLSVSIDRRFFETHDTHEKLCAVCEAYAQGAPRAVLRGPVRRDDQAWSSRRARHGHEPHDHSGSGEPVLTTIVKRLRWVGRPFPKATLDGHVAVIPAFGRVYFGEMLVSGHTRRLTMLRFDLEGDVSMDAACCEVEAGGSWCR